MATSERDTVRSDRRLGGDNRHMLFKLSVVVLLMFGFGYGLVPIYKHICEALGINVLSVSEQLTNPAMGKSGGANTQVDRTRKITVKAKRDNLDIWSRKSYSIKPPPEPKAAERKRAIRKPAR